MQAGERERNPLTQMRRGLVEYCVLALLRDRERYGVELAEVLTRHGLIAGEGTIYPLLSRLRKQGMVDTTSRESELGPPRRYYGLSAEGVATSSRFTADWTSLSESVNKIIRGDAS
jgi:PadR family transcriptional regulator PadR